MFYQNNMNKFLFIILLLFINNYSSAQIGIGYKSVQQPTVQYQYHQPTAYELQLELQLELQRRQALYNRNYNYVIGLKENINKLIQATNEKQFHHEMNAVLKRLNYFLENDLSLLTGEINKTQSFMGKSIKQYNKRMKKLRRKENRRKKRKQRRGW